MDRWMVDGQTEGHEGVTLWLLRVFNSFWGQRVFVCITACFGAEKGASIETTLGGVTLQGILQVT